MGINVFKSQNTLICFITFFFLLSIFSGFGDILIFKDYILLAPDPGVHRLREFLEVKKYSFLFKYTFILLATLINFYFFGKNLKNLNNLKDKKYWLIHIFFAALIISYIFSLIIYFEVNFIRKIIIIIFLYNSFLFFSLNEIKQNFIDALLKAIKITLILTLIIFLTINYIGDRDNYSDFITWPRNTSIISFINIRGNPITFIVLCLFAFYVKFEKNLFDKLIIIFISFSLVFLMQSRLGIVSILSFLVFFYLNKTKNKRFHTFMLYSSIFIIITYTYFGSILINIFFEYFVNYKNIIEGPYNYFENIKANCPFYSKNFKQVFSENCSDVLFLIAERYNMSSELFNFLNSFLYRLSYQHEAINLIINNNFKPNLYEFNQMSSNFVTDIGQIRHQNNLFTNVHNSFLLISLRITLLGAVLLYSFIFLICKKLIKLNEFNYLTIIIFIIFFHSFDDFFIGNHFAASLLTWIVLGIFFSKTKNA